ncbi:MAG: hypothetical protein BGO05_26290 [Rhizobiales bacterium 63-7]|nr:MAG: hypothetical protein BGO05_26290 [Rhizobiales bacterium 63-7]
MKTILSAIAVSALLLSGGAVGAKQTRAEKGEARLTKMLEGRTAGEPVSCISTMGSSSNLQVIDNTAVVYDGGKTIWVARPTDPRQLGTWDTLVIKRTTGSQLCTNDILYTVDQGTGFRTGSVFLEKFVPYTKTEG